jgi:putative RecB family exonuclease
MPLMGGRDAEKRGPESFSHSRLSSFEDCPKKFHYRYVLRIPSETESIEGFAGKRVHEVLERLYLAAAKDQLPSIARVIRRYHLLWDEHYDAERVRIVRSENGVDFYRENGERCLVNYYRRFYPFDADETLGLEQRVTFDLEPEGAYRIQGVIDRVVRTGDGAIEIHDYKTSQRVPRQEQLDRDRQLALYQIGIAQQYGEQQPIRLVWHFLLLDQVRRSSRTPAQLDQLRAQTIELIDRIRVETAFDPRPGPLCRWCEYYGICPTNPDATPAQVPQGESAGPEGAPPGGQLELL